MDGWLKGLVAAACVAVIAGVGIYGVTEIRRAEKAQAAEEAAARLAAQETDRRVHECRHFLQAWNAGDRGPAERRFGSRADDTMDACRHLIELTSVP